MANWKKMAEAFGRALGRPDIRNEMNTFDKNSKQGIKDRQELFDTMNRSAVNNGAEDEFMTGLTRAEDDNTEIARRTGSRDMSYDERQREFDKRTDERMDDELVRNRDDEWDAAFIHAQDLMGVPDEEMNDIIRSVIKELTQRGFTENDILNSLRTLGGR